MPFDSINRQLAYVLEMEPGAALFCVIRDLSRRRVARVEEAEEVAASELIAGHREDAIDPADLKLLVRLHMNQPIGRPVARLSGSEGAALLKDLVETGHCFWKGHSHRPLQWNAGRPGVADWLCQDKEFQPFIRTTPSANIVLPLTPGVYVDFKHSTCGPVTSTLSDGLFGCWASVAFMEIPETLRFLHQLFRQFPGENPPIPPGITPHDVGDLKPIPCLQFLQRPLSSAQQGPSAALIRRLAVRLGFDYMDERVPADSERTVIVRVDGDQLIRIRRNMPAETDFARRLGQAGFHPSENPAGEQAAAHWTLAQLPAAEDENPLDSLRREGWNIAGETTLAPIPNFQNSWYSEFEKKGAEGFEFETGLLVNGKRINLMPVVHRLLEQTRGLPLRDIETLLDKAGMLSVPLEKGGSIAIDASRIATIIRHLFDLFDDAPPKKGRLHLTLLHAADLAGLEHAFGAAWRAPATIKKLSEKLKAGLHLTPVQAPQDLKAGLREYQGVGLAWLDFLREFGVNGILADDMGLGKTVQLLAHLLAEKQNGRLKSPCLIVAPTSVLQSWRQEISKFTPELTVLEVSGPDRQPLLAGAGRADLILTSYGLVRNDVAHYAKLKLSHVVLDEAQFIKNAASLTARAVCCLNSPRRFCLTGTPIQNHLGELWSLFQFLMPGFLGSEQEFQRRFRTPIEDEQSPERRAILARRLAPFILRRTKEEVAKELPPRTEIVQTVSLSSRQSELYEAIRLAMESRVQEEIRGRGLARSQIVVLAALLKLRQICCDPRLTHPEEKLSIPEDSCKLEALMEMLPEMIEEGRKILLFSQFTTMLALIETALKEIAIPYVILTGSTKDRTEPVRSFQAGEVPLFLISLKAGGFGLNLTAADTVIHYDPWWNPAAEAQASDRAHRIGQDKPVFIYKLVAEGTVEAKILAMQEKKRDLVAGLLSEQPGHEMKLDAATLQDLFSPLG